jgi:hypothetical protein
MDKERRAMDKERRAMDEERRAMDKERRAMDNRLAFKVGANGNEGRAVVAAM